MGLFGLGRKKQWDEERSNSNKAKMRQLFEQVVADSEGYEIVYGYATSIKTSNYILARKTTYTYTSLIIGFRRSDMSIVILQTTPELEGCSDPEVFTMRTLKKAKMVQGGFTLYHQGGLMAGYTQFYISDALDESYTVYIHQPEEAAKWEAFWPDFLRS